MLVVQWWRSFACPGSRAEGKRYHDWDGCIERITQLDSWPDVRDGSSTEMLRLSISRLLFLAIADAPRPPGTPPSPRRGYRPRRGADRPSTNEAAPCFPWIAALTTVGIYQRGPRSPPRLHSPTWSRTSRSPQAQHQKRSYRPRQ